MNKRVSLTIGLIILFLLIVSYFIPIYQTRIYSDLADVKVESSLLRIIIFHSPYVLGLYVIIVLAFLYQWFRKVRFKIK